MRFGFLIYDDVMNRRHKARRSGSHSGRYLALASFSTAASFRAKRYRVPRRDLWPLSAPAVTQRIPCAPLAGNVAALWPPRLLYFWLSLVRDRVAVFNFIYFIPRTRGFIWIPSTWTSITSSYRHARRLFMVRPRAASSQCIGVEWWRNPFTWEVLELESSATPFLKCSSDIYTLEFFSGDICPSTCQRDRPRPDYGILCHTPIILSLSPLKNLLRSGCSLVYLATIYLELDIFDGVLVDLRLLCYAITAPEHSSAPHRLTNSYLPHSGFQNTYIAQSLPQLPHVSRNLDWPLNKYCIPWRYKRGFIRQKRLHII